MKKLFTVLTTAALFASLTLPAYAACPQNAANQPIKNCPTAKCPVVNILPQYNNLQQLPGNFPNWNTVLQTIIKQSNKTCTSQTPNQNQNAANGSNNGNQQNQPCVGNSCNNQIQAVPKPITPPNNHDMNSSKQPSITPDTQNSGYAAQVVTLVNAERAKEGLAPLKADNTLSAAAQVRAREIVSVFDHTRPNGTSCFTVLKEAGISYRGAGENIAYGQRTPEEVVAAWMNSPGHRANIMNKQFTTIGIGYHTVDNTAYWAQLFTY